MKFLLLVILYSFISDIHVQSVRTTAATQDNSTGVSVKISASGNVKSSPAAKLHSAWASVKKTSHMATAWQNNPSKKSTEQQILEELAVASKISDTSGTSKPTMAQIKEAMMSMGFVVPGPDLQNMFNQFDVDGDSALNLKEFMQIMKPVVGPVTSDEDLKAFFGFFDPDGDGKLSRGEVENVMINLGETFSTSGRMAPDGDLYLNYEELTSDEDLKAVYAFFDQDGDGKISRAEAEILYLYLNYEEFVSVYHTL